MPRPLHEKLPFDAAKREPPYRTVEELSAEEQKTLSDKLGDVQNLNPVILQQMARKDRRFLGALISGLLSAEFRGIDFVGRFTVETQTHDVPWHMTLGFARQTSDEARHTLLNTKLVEHLGSYVGEYPDIVLGPQGTDIRPEELDPAILLASINLALEGFALTFMEDVRKIAAETGEVLVDHCHDYNAADEITHVALGDYWLEQLSAEQPWRTDAAKFAQQAVETSTAVAPRELAARLVGADGPRED